MVKLLRLDPGKLALLRARVFQPWTAHSKARTREGCWILVVGRWAWRGRQPEQDPEAAGAGGDGSVLGLRDHLAHREDCRLQDAHQGGPTWVPVLAITWPRGVASDWLPALMLSIPRAQCPPACGGLGVQRGAEKSSRACFSSFVKSHLCWFEPSSSAFRRVVSTCQEIILGLSVPTREPGVRTAYVSSQGLNLGLACLGRGGCGWPLAIFMEA